MTKKSVSEKTMGKDENNDGQIKRKWKPLEKAKGIRYYKKKRSGIIDRFFSFRWSRNKKTFEESVGWESDGWNEGKVRKVYSTLYCNFKEGKYPSTLKELREQEARNTKKEKKNENLSN